MAEAASALPDLFTGRLAHCAEAVSFGRPGDDFIRAADLLRSATLESTVRRFGTMYPGGDARAIYSLWAQWYFGTILVPATALALGLRRALSLTPDQVALRLAPREQHPTAVRLPHKGRSAPDADDLTLLEPIVRGHLMPAVRWISCSSGLPPRTLWGNAATYIHWTLRQLDDHDGRPDRLHPLFSLPRWPDGATNPLRGTLLPVRGDSGPGIRRKVCCLRYLLPGVADCAEQCPVARLCARDRRS